MEETFQAVDQPSIECNQDALHHLSTMRKWTLFLSIVGLIAIALMALCGFFMIVVINLGENFIGEQYSQIPLMIIGILILLFCILYFFPSYYLLKFSGLVQQVLITKNSSMLSSAIKYLKNFFQYIGILTLCMFALYAIIFLSSIIASVIIR
ncbi:MAG TPA: hypothetical protein PK595_05590 [Bacteroidota bacterium]|nr:hypothetical protein [Bacteroidota bacterium]